MRLQQIMIIDDKEKNLFPFESLLGIDKGILRLESSNYLLSEKCQLKSIDLLFINLEAISGRVDKFLKSIAESPLLAALPILLLCPSKQSFELPDTSSLYFVDFVSQPFQQNEIKVRVKNLIQKVNLFKQRSEKNQELREINSILKNQKTNLEDTYQLKLDYAKEKELALIDKLEEYDRKMVSIEIEKGKLVKKLQNIIIEIRNLDFGQSSSTNGRLSNQFKSILRVLKTIIKEKESKKEFIRLFEKMEPSFIKKLTQKNAKLTPLDIKHCAYIRMNLDNYDLADIMSVELKSLQMSRYRIKKKLDLEKDQTLREYLLTL